MGGHTCEHHLNSAVDKELTRINGASNDSMVIPRNSRGSGNLLQRNYQWFHQQICRQGFYAPVLHKSIEFLVGEGGLGDGRKREWEYQVKMKEVKMKG